MIFRWKPGSRFKLSAQVVGERLKELEQRFDRRLRPEDVVEEARSPRSPLHKAFEWNTNKAAFEHLKQQARMMLNSIVTVYVDVERPKERKTTHVYVSIRQKGERSYRPIADVLEDEELRGQMLKRALDEFKSWRDRYRDLAELVDIFEAGNLVLGRIPRAKKVA